MNENNSRQNRQRPNGIRRPVNDTDFAKKRQNADYENQIPRSRPTKPETVQNRKAAPVRPTVENRRNVQNRMPQDSNVRNTRENPNRQQPPVKRPTQSQRSGGNGQRRPGDNRSANKGGNNQGDSKKTILIAVAVLLLIVAIVVFAFSGLFGGDENSNGNNTNQNPQSSLAPKEVVWYEQSEMPDPQEVQYTPPADAEFPYYIKVNRALCCVTVYGIDSNGEYTIPVKAFACSVGRAGEETILGEYQMSQNLGEWWCKMVDGTYGQFAYRIHEGYMFHSVPTYEMERDSLETEEFNKLGSPASLGCIRLNVRDAKWICDNCPLGTTTLIYDDQSSPGPLGKPDTIKLPIGHEWSGWDPTDPHEDNPWHTVSATIEASNIKVNIGEKVDILEKVKAYDTCGNDITDKMTWYGRYTFDQAGTYDVTFKVTDAIGNKAQKTIKITVIDPNDPNAQIEDQIVASVPAKTTNEITSEFAVLMNLDNGEILLNKKGNEKMYPASITKAVALLVTLENISDLNAEYVIKQETYDAVREQDASVANFPLEEPIKAVDLIHGSFMLSGAEATVTLAENIAGSEAAFVKLMNNKARELGMNNTNFTNATGLHDDMQYSTCEDLAIFLKAALENEQFRKIFTTKNYTTESFDEHPEGMSFSSTMFKFLGTNTPKNGFEILGGKTGYTSDAGLCLASVAKSPKTDNEYILITGKAPGNYWDVELPNHAFDALIAYGAIKEE